MAVKATKLQSTMILKYKDGVDKKGKDLIKKQRFPKIKPIAADEDIFTVGREIEKLLGKPLIELLVEQENALMGA